MTRYKVMVSTEDQLRQVEAFLAAEKACVVGSSMRLKFIATGNLTRAQQSRITDLGARVVQDVAYDPD
jgi:hypothetical protein